MCIPSRKLTPSDVFYEDFAGYDINQYAVWDLLTIRVACFEPGRLREDKVTHLVPAIRMIDPL